MRIFLDDERNPRVQQYDKIIRSYEDFLTLLEGINTQLTYISFDHDLGIGMTGYDCAKLLVDADLAKDVLHPNFDFNVHSANPVGAANIQAYLDNYLQFKRT